ncbi:MAG: hypothetical protein HYY19_04325 [Candidatus Rokubacteria bacterium]|nr:hypothetical protein [Candidatus Rokubacteria bacterium]
MPAPLYLGAKESFRPPLADNLFDRRPHFDEEMSKFEHVRKIASLLQHRQENKGVEDVLDELAAEPVAARPVQLASVSLYLQSLLWRCQNDWKEVTGERTNYKTLVDRIERWRAVYDLACFVTFNYDTMLEEAFSGQIARFDDYVNGPLGPIVKLHGSVNWARCIYDVADERGNDEEHARRFLLANFAHARISDEFVLLNKPTVIDKLSPPSVKPTVLTEWEVGSPRTPAPRGKVPVRPQPLLFPAIAVPMKEKARFECPPAHLEKLKAVLPRVDRILVIGWRAQERHFLDMLRESLTGRVRGMIVSGRRRSDAEEVSDRLSECAPGDYAISKGGFSDFVTTDEADSFLRA